jgi:hypothetical protein
MEAMISVSVREFSDPRGVSLPNSSMLVVLSGTSYVGTGLGMAVGGVATPSANKPVPITLRVGIACGKLVGVSVGIEVAVGVPLGVGEPEGVGLGPAVGEWTGAGEAVTVSGAGVKVAGSVATAGAPGETWASGEGKGVGPWDRASLHPLRNQKMTANRPTAMMATRAIRTAVRLRRSDFGSTIRGSGKFAS